MAGYARVEFNGRPGELWTNKTGRVQYQLIVNWHNSCAVCAQYDHAIGPSWPIPFHRNCRCRQIAIYPGHDAQPFVDFRKKIRDLDWGQQAKIMGRANLTLVEAKVVAWDDVVRYDRIRDLKEVVAARNLSVDTMVRAGVDKRIAENAYAAAHTAQRTAADDKRNDLIRRIQAKGVTKAELRKLVAERLAGRVGIGKGPSGPDKMPINPTPPPPPPPPPVKPPAPKPKPAPKPPKAVIPPPVKPPTPPQVKPANPGPPTPAELEARGIRRPVAAQVAAGGTVLGKAFADIEKAWDEQLQANYQRATAEFKKQKLPTRYSAAYEKMPQVVPGSTWPERLANYKVGDAKLAGMKAVATAYQAGIKKLAGEWSGLTQKQNDAYRAYSLARRDGSPPDRVKALLAEHDKVTADLKAKHKEIKDAQAKMIPAMHKVLHIKDGMKFRARDYNGGNAPLRPGETFTAPPPDLKARIQEAQDWLERVVVKDGLSGLDMIQAVIGTAPGQRASWSYGSRFMRTKPEEKVKTIIHEYGHGMDENLRSSLLGIAPVGEVSNTFRSYRVGSEQTIDMTKKFGLGGANAPPEMGAKDKFDEAFDEYAAYYVGKDYGHSDCTEIVSMGIEKLFEDPLTFIDKDPEYAKYIFGILDGSLR